MRYRNDVHKMASQGCGVSHRYWTVKFFRSHTHLSADNHSGCLIWMRHVLILRGAERGKDLYRIPGCDGALKDVEGL